MVGVSVPPPRHAHHRPALIALVAVAALAALALGWWQWERFSSASGTAQNLGYALQWPLFAGFAVFAYFRFVRMEQEARGGEEVENGAADTAAASAEPAVSSRTGATVRVGHGWAVGRMKSPAPREIPAGFLPERPKAARDEDPVLAEYNEYLARLHAADIDEQVRAATEPPRHTERNAG